MRPLQLSFSGIRSYPGMVGPLDFTGKTLIAIVGDTGAGKSTILEAISLALYGNCTWTDREHRTLMAEGAGQMTVDFTFAHDGHRWRVRRVYHSNTTPSSHLLRNLDTGEQVDNKRAVNRRIESLLQLNFDSFATAVLLPQGKFDRLLTATGTERTGLLKTIFGVQVIETVRTRAGQHRDQLFELIHQAELARGRLLDDPGGTAAREAAQAVEAGRIAAELQRAIGTLRRHRSDASAARERHEAISIAIDALRQHEARDAAAELTAISAAEEELSALETAAAQDKQQWAGHRTDADSELAAAARDGFTVESLASAATLLDALPARLGTLAAGQVQLDKDAAANDEEAAQLDKARAGLTDMRAAATSLADDHAAVSAELQEFRQARSQLEDAARISLNRAADSGKAQREEEAAVKQETDFLNAITALETAAAAASGELQSAEEHLGHIRSQNAAHTAGADLAPGDPCRICSRLLPDGYQPPAPADPAALHSAESALKKAKAADRKAAEELADAKGKAASARQASSKRQSAAAVAQDRLEQAQQVARARMLDLALLGRAAEPSSPGEAAFRQMLESACSRLAASAEEEHDQLQATLLADLLRPSAAAERELSTAATHSAGEARTAEAAAEREADNVSLRQANQEKAEAALEAARRRHRTTEAVIVRELKALPAQLRQILPDELLSITAGHVHTARQAVIRQKEELTEQTRLRDEAARKIEDLAAEQRLFDQRRRKEVDGKLHSLATHLERRQDVIERAIRVLPGDDSPVPVPGRPAAVSVVAISSYASALTRADEAAAASLSQAAGAAAAEAGARMARLRETANRLAAGKGGLPVIALPAGDALLDPASLDAVVSAETIARNDAERHRANQKTSEAQVEKAASLDAALREGRSRLNAVQALHGLLADSKFLQYLTDRRTRALLAVASDTFGTLSRGEFGFSGDFQVVSRRSGAARSPKTLSGGETFLASLALALALVELHSRSGGRLGALFLDEGFASLDVGLLADALTVLQAETGGDKLVAVISHLHAVAEAVQDVMWVERGPAGSAARWLTPGERDALVRQDVTGGLLSLL